MSCSVKCVLTGNDTGDDQQPIREQDTGQRKCWGQSHRSVSKHQHIWHLQETILSFIFLFFVFFFSLQISVQTTWDCKLLQATIFDRDSLGTCVMSHFNSQVCLVAKQFVDNENYEL